MKYFYLIVCSLLSALGFSQLSVTANQTAATLANNLLGGGVTISNPTLTCAGVANGIFTNGSTTSLGFNQGVLLSTGRVIDAAGAASNFASTSNGTAGIPAMGSSTFDGCYLGFQITPKCNNLSIRYRFASEEYNGYVSSSYNDAFGFFISGPNPSGGNYANLNMATVPGFTNTEVAVNTINNGNNNTGPCVNCTYYTDNRTGATLTADGMTSILTANANVTPCSTYTLFMALVDRNDAYYDSQVFLEKSGISCSTPTLNVANSTICAGQSATLTASGVSSYTWSTGEMTPSIVVSPGSTQSYTVSGGNIGTCIQDTKVVTVTVNNAPTANAGPTSTLNCISTSANLTGSGGGTYSWTGPGSITNPNSSTASVTQPGTYSLIVTVAGCPSLPATVQVFQDNTPPAPSITNATTLTCLTTTAALSGSGGGTYSWSGPGIVSGGSTSTPTVNAPGNYNLTVTAANGCTATANTTVMQNIATPTLTMPPTQTITCGMSSISLEASSSPSTADPVWTGGVTSGATSYTATVSSANIYTLTVTDPSNGCSSTGTTEVVASGGFPAVTGSTTNTITCITTTAQVIATTTDTPVSYTWTGPGIVSGASSSSADVNVAGDYTVVVQNTSTSCSSTIVVNVPANTTVITPTASVTQTLTCNTTSLTINGSPASGVTYTWTGAGITGSANLQNVDVNQTGVYTLSVTNSDNGCVGSTTVSVTDDLAVPTISVTPQIYTLTCATSSVQITASSLTSDVTYSWSTSGGSLNNANIPDPIATSSGTYIVTVTNSLTGCYSTETVTIVPDAAVPVSTVASNTVISCLNTTQTATVTTTPSANITYSWSPLPASGGNSSTPTFSTSGIYSCLVTNTTNSCTATVQITISTDTVRPSISFDPIQTITCSNPSVTINSVVSPTTGITYSWAGTGIIGSTTNGSVDVNSSGNYDLTVLNAANGCTASAVASVISNGSIPTLTVAPTTKTLTCNVTSINLNASSGSAGTPVWSTATGTLSNPVTATAAGNYTVNVTDPVTGCSSFQVVTISNNTTSPGAAGASTVIPCGVSSILLSGTSSSTNSVSYQWSGPGIVSGNTTANPLINQAGVYTFTVTDNVNGCTSTATVNVTQGTINAAFSADPSSGEAPLTVNFTDASTGAINYDWDFANGSTSVAQNPSTVYSQNGVYTVTLIVTAGTCKDTATTTIIVNDGFSLEIPNVFTPNGDGSNEFFTIKSTGLKELSLQIFNRWGEKLHETSGINSYWNGSTSAGAKVPEGTYFYFVKATGLDGKEVEQHGSVNLFR